jgi:hypothetical protein
MATQIFISYSHSDMEFASKLTKDLEQAGYEVWLDRTDIQTGARWDDEIVKGLNASEIFLVILSNKSTASQNVKDEIGYAMDHNKQIVPILLEACEVPFRLRRVQYVDFTALKFEEGMKKVLTILKSFMPNQEVELKIKPAAKKEKLMDPVTVAATVTTLLAPYLVKMGESAMQEVGKKMPEKIGKLWEAISNRFKGNPAAAGAADDLIKNAEDTDNQQAFELQLKKALKEDEEFAGALQALLKEAQKEAQGSITNTGDGAVATNGSMAVGKVAITGNVGNLTISNNK